MNQNKHITFLVVTITLALMMLACGLFTVSSDAPPNNAVVVDVVANTSLTPWLETAVSDFNNSAIENSDGDPYYVQLTAVDAGQAITELADGASPAMWIPDDKVWTNVLADQGNANYQNDCVSVAESPLVIGMWRDVAKSLGWPGLPLGWLDIGSLAADPSAWNYYSGGELGDAFRLGHTHPGLSATGVDTLLAVVHAAQAKTDAVTANDIQQPIVQASVGAFEGGVTWFSSDTASLGTTMSERGITYLSAAIMYESTVVQVGGGNIVPVYPLEGTFVATHPACINGSAGSDMQAGARAFRDYLIGNEGQQTAVSALGIIWTLTIPAAAMLVLLGQPAIIFFLQGNVFDAASTRLVYSVLIVFSVRVVSEATVEIVARLFYAQHNTRTPMFVYVGWLVVNVSIAYLLVQGFGLGVVGLAAASTIAFTVLAVVLFQLNRNRLHGLAERELAVIGGRAVVGTAVMSVVMLFIGLVITSPLLYMAVAGAAGGITYIIINLILGGKEIPLLLKLMREKTAV